MIVVKVAVLAVWARLRFQARSSVRVARLPMSGSAGSERLVDRNWFVYWVGLLRSPTHGLDLSVRQRSLQRCANP